MAAEPSSRNEADFTRRRFMGRLLAGTLAGTTVFALTYVVNGFLSLFSLSDEQAKDLAQAVLKDDNYLPYLRKEIASELADVSIDKEDVVKIINIYVSSENLPAIADRPQALAASLNKQLKKENPSSTCTDEDVLKLVRLFDKVRDELTKNPPPAMNQEQVNRSGAVLGMLVAAGVFLLPELFDERASEVRSNNGEISR